MPKPSENSVKMSRNLFIVGNDKGVPITQVNRDAYSCLRKQALDKFEELQEKRRQKEDEFDW
jgi:hypothetical protein